MTRSVIHLRVLDGMFAMYRELMDAGNEAEAEKYKLVRS